MTARAAATAGAIWGGAPFDRIAAGAAASHEALVSALDLGPGTRLLDVATGTGAVALRASECGAVVTAVDIAPQLLERARTAALAAGLAIEFRIADAQQLPFAPGSFDGVASAQGAVFALDREAVARELARVCRPGGLLGLTCPIAAGFAFELARILASFRPGARDDWLRPFVWGDSAEAERLLGREFALVFEELAAPFRVATPREGWDVYSESFGPLAELIRSLGPEGRAELRARVLKLLGRYVTSDGVVAPRPLLLVVGRRSARTRDGRAAGANLVLLSGADAGLDAIRDCVRSDQRDAEAGEIRLGVGAAHGMGLLERGGGLLEVHGRGGGDPFALRRLRGLTRRTCGMRACAKEIGADDERGQKREEGDCPNHVDNIGRAAAILYAY